MAADSISKKQWALLTSTLCLLLAELIVSRLCDSLIALLDTFHTLSVALSLALPILLRLLAKWPSPGSFTFGWQRIPLLGTLISSLLLASLCFSITMDAIGRLVNPHPPHRPVFAISIGAVSTAINLMIGIFFWNRESTWQESLEFEDLINKKDTKQNKNEEERGSDILQPKREKHQILPKFQADDMDHVARGGPGTSQEDLTWNGQVGQCRSDERILIAPEKQPEISVQRTEESQFSSFKEAIPRKESPPKVKVEIVSIDNMDCHGDDSLGFDSVWRAKEGDEKMLLWNPCVQETSEDQEQIWLCPASEENMAGDEDNDCDKEKLHTSHRTFSRETTPLHFVLWLLKSLLSPSLVLTNGLLYHFLDHECLLHTGACFFHLYLDPIFCLITVIVLVTTAFPLIKNTGYLLLQGVPAHMDLQKLEGTLKSLPELEGSHELHVWQLSGGNTVASVHIMCINPQVYTALEHKIQSIFYHEGITTLTIQPEFLQSPGEGASVTSAFCNLACGKACSKQLCCDRWRGATSEPPLPVIATPSEASSKEFIFSNIYT